MLVKQEQVSPCEVEIEVEVDLDKVNTAFDDTYAELGKNTAVPGFRKGKAPRVVLEQFLDKDGIKERVASRLIRKAYSQALEDSKLEAFAPADVEMVKFEDGEPLVFKAKVPLAPKIELGDYVGLEVERRLPNVPDTDVEAEINGMLERRAEFTDITDRGVQLGDVIVAEMKDDEKQDESARPISVEVGHNLPDFDKGVVGMNVGEEKVIEVTYPDDYDDEELRGRTVPIRTKVHEIREKKVPELTDEWVKENFVGEPKEGEEPPADPVDTVEKLRAKVKSVLEEMERTGAEAEVRDRLVEMAVAGSNVCFPQMMVNESVDERVERLVEELKSRKLDMEAYLKHVGKSHEELREEYAQEARETLTRALVLREIRSKENIEAKDEDLKAELAEMAKERGVPVETMQAYVEKTKAEESIRARVLRKKVVDFLVHASNIKNVAR